MKHFISTVSIVLATFFIALSSEASSVRDADSSDDLLIEGPDEESTAESGTGVNNGMGPIGRILDCQSESGLYSFSIVHTAIITYKQATLKIGDQTLSMLCKNSDENDPSWTGAAQPWSCTEIRDGERLYHVEVFAAELGSDAFTGLVSIDRKSPLKSLNLSTMTCRKPSAK